LWSLIGGVLMTITLSRETEIRLLAEAKRRNVEVDQLAEQLIDAALPPRGEGTR